MGERGTFIVFEGGGGSGKTANLMFVAEHFLRNGWRFTREPGGTAFGDRVRDAVQCHQDEYVHPIAALFGYNASRANLVNHVIRPTLAEGVSVGLDRYYYSTLAYQGSDGVGEETIKQMCLIATGGLEPDVVLYYDVDPAIGMRRKQKNHENDRFDQKDLQFQTEVRERYLKMARNDPKRWEIIDANPCLDTVQWATVETLRRRGMIK